MTNHYRMCLAGFGNVGKAFAELLLKKKNELASRYNLSVSVTGIITGTHGAAINPDGIDLERALDLLSNGKPLDSLSILDAPQETNAFISACPADFLFEITPVNHQTGQPAISHIKTAFQKGMHAVTANKGPVVYGHQELTALAAQHGVSFLFEFAVMDGAPIFTLFRQTLVARISWLLKVFSIRAPTCCWR